MSRFIMLVGIAGSGKSTFGRKLCATLNDKNSRQRAVLFSSDDIRQELFGDANCQDNPQLVFSTLHKRIIAHLADGYTAIYDATNLNAKRRAAFLTQLPKSVTRRDCIVVTAQFTTCVSRQSQRERKVPSDVIQRQLFSFQPPYYNEGWDNIEVARTDEGYDINAMLEQHHDMNQFNPHHALSLGDHLTETVKLLLNAEANDSVLLAGALHDIGKPMTQAFDREGIAHYQNHANVGAYLFLASYDSDSMALYNLELLFEVAALICWHMLPFQFKDDVDAQISAWCQSHHFDECFGRNLRLLHNADINSDNP